MSDEAHLSAEQSRPQAASRVPQPHGDSGRPQGAARTSCPRPQEPVGLNEAAPSLSLHIIRKRADFLACNKGRRQPMPGFVLLVRDRKDGDPAMRLGITVTKKIGGAVVRNRMKRRFRALARTILPQSGVTGADHVLIGRSDGIERDFSALTRELEKALVRVKAPPSEQELRQNQRRGQPKRPGKRR